MNKLTGGVNPTLEESREDVDKADGDQQGDPVVSPSGWYTGGVLSSGSVGDMVRRWEGEPPRLILSKLAAKSSSSPSIIGWPLVILSPL